LRIGQHTWKIQITLFLDSVHLVSSRECVHLPNYSYF
jgi:hypothetical protein